MPTSISNPASFSSVRSAFSAEGYGSSTSLFAYRQGGGIVPATSAFNVIGAGTAGDPLQLSQFNGFSVPSLYLDVQYVTPDYIVIFDAGFASSRTLHGYSINGAFTAGYPFGAINDGTSNLYMGASIASLYHEEISYGGTSLWFVVSGNQANSGWTTITIGGYTFYRAAASYGYAPAYGPVTYWYWGTPGVDPFNFGPGDTTVTWS